MYDLREICPMEIVNHVDLKMEIVNHLISFRQPMERKSESILPLRAAPEGPVPPGGQAHRVLWSRLHAFDWSACKIPCLAGRIARSGPPVALQVSGTLGTAAAQESSCGGPTDFLRLSASFGLRTPFGQYSYARNGVGGLLGRLWPSLPIFE